MTGKNLQPISAPDWGQHLIIVFTVLIGVSLAQAFTILGESHLHLTQLLLISTVIYVVFDCWYALNIDVRHISATGGFDITLYLLTLVAYSCLPFLYLAHTANTPAFEAPEFLAANLTLICLLDATQRAIVFRRNGNNAPYSDEKWHAKNSYLMFSGYVFGFMLIFGTIALAAWDASPTLHAGAILVGWVLIRVFDHWGSDKIVNRMLEMFKKESDSKPDPSESTP